MPELKMVSVHVLWERLYAMEEERRFNGNCSGFHSDFRGRAFSRAARGFGGTMRS